MDDGSQAERRGPPVADLVCDELARRGYVAVQCRIKGQTVEIVATNAAGSRTVTLRVKSNKGTRPEWVVSASGETLISESLFYVFVLREGLQSRPAFYVVESETVAEHIAAGLQRWLSKPRRDGHPRADTSMRKFRDPEAVYLDGWHRLGL